MMRNTLALLAIGTVVLAALDTVRAQAVSKGEIPRSNSASQDRPFVYRAFLDRNEDIAGEADSADASELPTPLLIPPGRYLFYGNAYDLRKQGLYRFGYPLKENRQRIVYDDKDGDVEALLSAIAWIAAHGNSDNPKSDAELNKKAATGKLFITCGRVSRWAISLLTRQGIRARTVHSLTLGQWRSYDSGHTMIEVYRQDLKKWVLYDLDENACFLHRQAPLSLVEMVDRAASGEYETKALAADAMLDVSNFHQDGYDLSIFMESIQSENGRRDWYQRILQVPLIEDCVYLPGAADSGRARLETNMPPKKYTCLKKDDFLKKFYGKDFNDANRDGSRDGNDARRSDRPGRG